ncbi:hypothetical protein RHGRI_018896 [Rhododendron griersonianum]|uniref:DYW domain-containing protein n=1 Tax=Rhododendron griersonianum TaxID=479676 RepID=A0AAV6K3B0_9ERIC|nr:hypothetical protein RHGRI_018896 [Rhododendron griersonianum]
MIKSPPKYLKILTRIPSSLKFGSLFDFSTTSPSIFPLPNHFQPCIQQTADHTIHHLSHHPKPEISIFFHKGFSEITDETVGRALHAVWLKGSTHLATFHMNTLINMYSKFGKFEPARYLFDTMPERNGASWNTMMSLYVRAGSYPDAVKLFRDMGDPGIKPSGYMVASLMTACSRSNDMVYEGFQIHGFIFKAGLLWDVFVGTALLQFYGVYGFCSSAKSIFDEMPVRNVVTWTSLMVGYSDNGDPVEVLNVYKQMRHEGVGCSQNAFTTVIGSCALLEDESVGHQVLAHVIKSGYETNVSVANSLVSMFGSLSTVKDACYVFEHMVEHDTISWNSMVSAYAHNALWEESLRCFCLMRLVHGEIDSITLSIMLSVCGTSNTLKWGTGIHGLAVKLSLDSDVWVSNTLLTMYSEAGRLEDAKELFEGMPARDLISWNSIMAGYVLDGKCLDALKILDNLLKMQSTMNYVTFASSLAACSNPEFLAEGKVIHTLVIMAGLHDNLIVGNALVTMYGKCGEMGEAKQVFQKMPKKDLVTWNALIGAYAENEEPDEAMKLFKLMRVERTPANYITVVNVLGACLAPNALLIHGMPIHAHTVSTGFESDDYVKNSLITMYAKCGDLNSCSYVFSRLLDKNPVTWNAMVAANAHHGDGEEALKLFLEMHRAGIGLDQFSFSAAQTASANLAILDEGQQLHCLATKLGFDSSQYVTNAIMDMYGKCGEVDDVQKMLPEPKMRSRLSWNILISAFARFGCFDKARETFHDMLKLGSKPDHVTFVSLLSACSHGGLVDEGLAYFNSMSKEFGVPAGIEHCVCIIDLLGRSGKLSEAENFIEEMPIPPNDFVWRSLLASCRIHGNLELGRKATEHLLQFNPSDDSAFVLYSNVCAKSGNWDYVENVRGQMQLRHVKKQPACSWIKLKNVVSSFGIGDRSHPRTRQIYTKLGELRKMITEAGYVPDTTFSLHDTDEEQKEHNLWNHSERLALAYGLINAKEGLKLRIFMNLRVCGDCHSVFKFISEIIQQEIILRDPYRFHHFSSGKCSCGDYW